MARGQECAGGPHVGAYSAKASVPIVAAPNKRSPANFCEAQFCASQEVTSLPCRQRYPSSWGVPLPPGSGSIHF